MKADLLRRYLIHMYKTVSNLYLFHRNPLELIQPDYPALTIKPHKLSRVVMILSQLEGIMNSLGDLVKIAERMLLTERRVGIDESWEIRGVISWPQTVMNLPRFNPPAQVMFRSTLYSVENMLLRLIVEEIHDIVRKLKSLTEHEYIRLLKLLNPLKVISLQGYKDLMDVMTNIQNRIELFLTKSFLSLIPPTKFLDKTTEIKRLIKEVSLQPWKPKWVEELLTIASKIVTIREGFENLKDILVHVQYRSSNDVVKGVRFLAWKLYELYVLYVVLNTIKRSIPYARIDGVGKEFYISFDSDKILLLYNEQPQRKGIPSRVGNGVGRGVLYNGIPSSVLKRSSGRPDVLLISDDNVIIIEAKFTRNPCYLNQSRFKVLAYMYEYNAKVGVLAYPGVKTREILDDEDADTIELLMEAEKKGGIELNLINGSKIYLLPIKPLKDYPNEKIISKVLTEFLTIKIPILLR